MAVGEKHRGREVTKQKIKMTGAERSLRATLEVDPYDFRKYGERVFILTMCEANGDGYTPVGEKEVAETIVLDMRTSTILDPKIAATFIEEQRARIDAAEQAKKEAEQMALDPLNLDGRDEVGAKRKGRDKQGADADGDA